MTDGKAYQSKSFQVQDTLTADQLLSFQDSQDRFLRLRYEYIQIAGSLNAGAVLSEIVGWTMHYLTDPNRQGWHYKTAEDWEAIFKMGRRPFEAARDSLIELGVIFYRKEGMPLRSWYRANLSRIVELRLIHQGIIDGREFGVDAGVNPLASLETDSRPAPAAYAAKSFVSQFGQNVQTSLSGPAVCTKRTNKNGRNVQTGMAENAKPSSCKESTKSTHKETRAAAPAAGVAGASLDQGNFQSDLSRTIPQGQEFGSGLTTHGNLALVSDTAAAVAPELDTAPLSETAGPQAEQPEPKKWGVEIRQAMAALQTAFGKIPDGKAQAGSVKWMLDAGWEIGAIIACFEELRVEGWRSSRYSFHNVKKDIGMWAGRIKEQHDQADGAGQALSSTPAFLPGVEPKFSGGRVVSLIHGGKVYNRADFKASDFDALVGSLRA